MSSGFLCGRFSALRLSAVTGIEWLDPLGNMTMASSMKAGAWAHIPGYQGGFAFTIADKPVEVVQSFRWEGVPWTASQILLRLAWCGVAIVLVLLAAAVFDRFDSARWFGRARRKAGASGNEWRVRERCRDGKRRYSNRRCCGGAERLFRSACFGENRASATDRVGRRRSQQRICAFVCRRAETCDQRSALVVVRRRCGTSDCAGHRAVGASPGSNLLGTSWLWLVLVWSAMGARETRFGTRALLFSSARILPRQLLACWLAGFVLAVLFGSAAGLRILATQGALALLPWIAGAAFLPSLALALGVWSGTSKPFEGILTAMWYIGPINRVSGIDYTGSSNGPETMHYVVVYLLTATALLVAAAALRSRQIRSN